MGRPKEMKTYQHFDAHSGATMLLLFNYEPCLMDISN